MNYSGTQILKRTPFYPLHHAHGARLIDFGGFEMPVQYSGIRDEHEAVRDHLGLFDVSHMGEVRVTGPQALPFIQHITINDASKLVTGQAQYTVMCYENGGIVDDLLVYRLGAEKYMLVINAANREKDVAWMKKNNDAGAALQDISDEMCLLAVQGPDSTVTLQKLTDIDLSGIGFYRFAIGSLAGFDSVIISETGYTGEKGYELYFDRNHADPEVVWEKIMEAGFEFGIRPAGLGARDTLRLEMGYALYGNDITRDTNPLEAGLGWLTKLDKGPFIGRDALLKIKAEGISRRLTGFVMDELKAIPRSHYAIEDEAGNRIGEVTSGTMSITLKRGIGMGYVAVDQAKEGNTIYINIRDKRSAAKVVKLPFIKMK